MFHFHRELAASGSKPLGEADFRLVLVKLGLETSPLQRGQQTGLRG